MTARDTDTTRAEPDPKRTLPPHTASAWDGPEYQWLWLRMQSRGWRTLAIVPSEDWMPTYDVANLVMAVGVHHGASIGVFDVRNIGLNRILGVVEDVCEQMRPRDRIIFATRTIQDNIATIPLARACDGVVLCASLGSTRVRSIEHMIEQIGRDHFLGSVLLRERSRAAPPRMPLSRLLVARW